MDLIWRGSRTLKKITSQSSRNVFLLLPRNRFTASLNTIHGRKKKKTLHKSSIFLDQDREKVSIIVSLFFIIYHFSGEIWWGIYSS